MTSRARWRALRDDLRDDDPISQVVMFVALVVLVGVAAAVGVAMVLGLWSVLGVWTVPVLVAAWLGLRLLWRSIFGQGDSQSGVG